MSFTVKYAAPETIKAFRRGDETVKVHPAVDVWAFGVICFELLTNQKFYGEGSTAGDVMALLDSDGPLPVEKGLEPRVERSFLQPYSAPAKYLRTVHIVKTQHNKRILSAQCGNSEHVECGSAETATCNRTRQTFCAAGCLGTELFRNSILRSLSRDPAARPSVSELIETWNSVFPQPSEPPSAQASVQDGVD